jgi:hypothetical protein
VSLYLKDPEGVLDFAWDWSKWLLAGETIQASDVIVPSGITLDSKSNTTTTATAWLKGGTAGTSYVVTNRITTNQGRTDDRSITIHVIQR